MNAFSIFSQARTQLLVQIPKSLQVDVAKSLLNPDWLLSSFGRCHGCVVLGLDKLIQAHK